LVVGEGRHDLGLGRPHRIGMLAVDLFEALGGLLVLLLTQRIERAVVEHLDGLLDIVLVVIRGAAAARKPERHYRERQPDQCASSPSRDRFRHKSFRHTSVARGYITVRRKEKKRGPQAPREDA